MYYLMLPTPQPPATPLPPITPLQLTPNSAIAIDGDANFSATALLEGWPGDGSPENPYIIDGLEIDLGGRGGHCISISNTRARFTINNCNVSGARGRMPMYRDAGIYLENVTNGELVNNTYSSNIFGIQLRDSTYNTVANNTCNDNWYGIVFHSSDSNTVVNNTCNRNENRDGIYLLDSNHNTVSDNTCNNNGDFGIHLLDSDHNTVSDNTCFGNTKHGIYLDKSDYNTVANSICNSNDIGIELHESDSNTIANNTCNYNRIGIHLDESLSNTGSNNNCLDNTEHDIIGEFEIEEFVFDESAHQEYVAKQFVWFLAGCGMILVVSVVALVQFRRMKIP